jgi:hypothetical protein
MSDWTPPPEPLTWELPKPLVFGSQTYSTITLRAPSGGDVLKASAMPGASPYAVSINLIAIVSAEKVPYQALARDGEEGLPAHLIEQMASYLDLFGGAPIPGPLDIWHKAQVAKQKEQAKAVIDLETGQAVA